jgi:hypothetical protein
LVASSKPKAPARRGGIQRQNRSLLLGSTLARAGLLPAARMQKEFESIRRWHSVTSTARGRHPKRAAIRLNRGHLVDRALKEKSRRRSVVIFIAPLFLTWRVGGHEPERTNPRGGAPGNDQPMPKPKRIIPSNSLTGQHWDMSVSLNQFRFHGWNLGKARL